jgi:hypothetical protein
VKYKTLRSVIYEQKGVGKIKIMFIQFKLSKNNENGRGDKEKGG